MIERFVEHGPFVLKDGAVRLQLDEPLPVGWSVYAFRQNDEWMYVGSAKRTRQRLQGYHRHQTKASQSRVVHVALREAVAAGPVAVLAMSFADPIVEFDGMPVHAPLGIEAGLIHRLGPPWNRRGVDRASV